MLQRMCVAKRLFQQRWQPARFRRTRQGCGQRRCDSQCADAKTFPAADSGFDRGANRPISRHAGSGDHNERTLCRSTGPGKLRPTIAVRVLDVWWNRQTAYPGNPQGNGYNFSPPPGPPLPPGSNYAAPNLPPPGQPNPYAPPAAAYPQSYPQSGRQTAVPPPVAVLPRRAWTFSRLRRWAKRFRSRNPAGYRASAAFVHTDHPRS